MLASHGVMTDLARPIRLTDQLAITDLRTDLRGRVITPDDPDYDAARAVTLGGIDRRPAVIVRVADAGDVARAIALAARRPGSRSPSAAAATAAPATA